MKKRTRKLSLKKETLRSLNAPALGKVNGGRIFGLPVTSFCLAKVVVGDGYSNESHELSEAGGGI